MRRKESSAGSHTVCTKVREKEIEWEGTTGAEEEERRVRRGRRYGVLDLFSRTTVEQNGLKLWGSGAFFLPPQGMYYPVSDYFIFYKYRAFTGKLERLIKEREASLCLPHSLPSLYWKCSKASVRYEASGCGIVLCFYFRLLRIIRYYIRRDQKCIFDSCRTENSRIHAHSVTLHNVLFCFFPYKSNQFLFVRINTLYKYVRNTVVNRIKSFSIVVSSSRIFRSIRIGGYVRLRRKVKNEDRNSE